jgi:hypothetical protein
MNCEHASTDPRRATTPNLPKQQFPGALPEWDPLARFNTFLLINVVLARLGDSGNLVMPTFTNGFTRSVAFAGARVSFFLTPMGFICELIEEREVIV